MLVCGLGLVVFVRLCQRRFAREALAAAAICGGLFVASIVVIFGGHSSGMAIRPWRVFARISIYQLVTDKPAAEADTRALVIAGILCCAAWLLGNAGLLILVARARELLRDPGVVFLVGVSIGGFVAMLLTDQPGNSQLYFHRTAVPAIAALAAAGAWMLVWRFGDRLSGLAVAGFVLAGLGAAWAGLQILISRDLPPTRFRGPDGNLSTMALIEPWLWILGLLLVGALLVTVLWKVSQGAGRPSRVLAAGFVIACLAGGLMPQLQALPNTKSAEPRPLSAASAVGPTASAASAARWLRDHSSPDDLVTTNAHCVVANSTGCDARHFWIAALTERHLLVEGWGYTNTINDLVAHTGQKSNHLPFWDPSRLEANDRVFTAPTSSALELLRTQYGVRWLYAHELPAPMSSRLSGLVTLRHDAGDVQIYELR